MRIISGTAKGIPLTVPKGEVRPTTDRVREALFSILHPIIQNANVLDLFSGSGAFALEALSRGAKSAKSVDFSRTSCATAKANAVKCRLSAHSVIQGDAVAFVKKEVASHRHYGVVFADPPYCKGPGDKDYIAALAAAGVAELLEDDGILIAEVEAGRGIGSSNNH